MEVLLQVKWRKETVDITNFSHGMNERELKFSTTHSKLTSERVKSVRGWNSCIFFISVIFCFTYRLPKRFILENTPTGRIWIAFEDKLLYIKTQQRTTSILASLSSSTADLELVHLCSKLWYTTVIPLHFFFCVQNILSRQITKYCESKVSIPPTGFL